MSKPITIGESSRIAAHECYNCGAKLDAVTPIDTEGVPKCGDVTVCGYCGSFMIFNEELKTREMTATEIAGMTDEQRNLMVKLSRFATSGILKGKRRNE